MEETSSCTCGPSFGAAAERPANALSFEGGFFVFDDARPLMSSGNKLIFPGSFIDTSGKVAWRFPAVAVYFLSNETYALELSNMKVAEMLGAGPKLFACGDERLLPESAGRGHDERCPVLIEEHVGTSLKNALAGKPIPRLTPSKVGGAQACGTQAGDAGGAPAEDAQAGGACDAHLEDAPAAWHGISLEPANTEAGQKQTAKLLFDIFCQLHNLQKSGKCHRDLKAANICVKACGEHPWDLRATLIDLEFGTASSGDGVQVRSERYHRILFEQAAARAGRAPVTPNPLQQDMGYLTLVTAEIENRCSVGELTGAQVNAALAKSDGFFAYENDGSLYVRKIRAADLEQKACAAGLTPVSDMGKVSARAVEVAERVTKHGGYLDALDLKRLEGDADMLLERENDRIARQIFENYKAHRVRDGKTVEYETFDSQPEDFKESCRDQARGMRSKMESLDFDIVPCDECPEERRVDALSERQVEYLAELEHERWVAERTRLGWTYAPGLKDVEAKTSPYLVPWNELDEDIKGYDRDPVREMADMLKAAGFAICRRA